MVVKGDTLRRESVLHMKGGEGTFHLTHVVEKKVLRQAGRLFARGWLNPEDSVGWHIHEKEIEICYFLSGNGEVIEEDGRHTVATGDVEFCLPGHGHKIVNTGLTPLEYIAVVLYQDGN